MSWSVKARHGFLRTGVARGCAANGGEVGEGSGCVFDAGSSLVVYPAAQLPEIAKNHGAKLVIINRDETPLDGIADLVINAPLGEVIEAIEENLYQSPHDDTPETTA